MPEGAVAAATSIVLPDRRPDLSEIVMLHVARLSGELKFNNQKLFLDLKRDLPLRFYTLSVWAGREAMMSFTNGDLHRQAMDSQPGIIGEVISVVWEPTFVPTWPEVADKLEENKRAKSGDFESGQSGLL